MGRHESPSLSDWNIWALLVARENRVPMMAVDLYYSR